jgi:polar amino acid transport system substrate-binding protein
MRPTVPRLAGLAAAAVLLAACTGQTASPIPSTAASAAASAVESVATSAAPSASAVESAAASVAASAVASISADQLITPDKLTVCIDIPYPPQEFFDDQGNPTGSDVDISAEIARRLGLGLTVNNTVFDTIIAALQGHKCDIIVSAQNITSDRVKQVDMIPYFQAGQSFLVAKGNPKGINTVDDLCGKSVAAETGTTEVDYVNGTGDYKGAGLSKGCTDKGKSAITMKEFEKDSDALLALQAGQVDAYFADQPVATNYANTKSDSFELAPIPPLAPALEGISVLKDHKPLEVAVQAALASMIADGTYANILNKYQLQSGAITADLVAQVNKTK